MRFFGRFRVVFLLASLFLVGWWATHAGESQVAHRYYLGRHGAMFLELPKSWKEEVQRPGKDKPLTVTLKSKSKPSVLLLITPLWSAGNDPSFNSPEKVRALVQAAGEKALVTAAEPQLFLEELQGTMAHGFLVSLTDRNPKPEEWPRAKQGIFALGDLLVSFTLLHHNPEAPEVQEALQALRESRFERGVFKVYGCELLDFKFRAALAEAAGIEVKPIADKKRRFEINVKDFHIVAEPVEGGLGVSLTGDNLDEGSELLDAMMNGVESF